MFNTIIQLYLSFALIGFTSFGGLSMIPLINDQMLTHGWMTQSEVADIIAIAEMTPGPLGINCATFAGFRTAGALGSIAAALGALTPSITVAFIAAIFFEKFKKSRGLQYAMVGLRPATIGMIAGVLISLSLTNYVDNGAVSYISMGISLLDVFLLMKCKLSIPLVVLISAAIGTVLFGVLGLV